MKATYNHLPHAILGSILCASVLQASAQWTTIYSDTFSGPAGTSLNGRAVEFGTGSWTLNNNNSFDSWKADGSTVAGGVGVLGQTAMQLAFTPSAGYKYQLSARIAPSSASGHWVGFGFGDRLTSSDGASGLYAYGDINGISWLFYGDSGSGGQFNAFGGPDVDNPLGGSWTGGNNPADFRIVLDTSEALWKTSLFITPSGGSEIQIGSTFAYAANPTIAAVGFSKGQNFAGAVDNFKLEAQVVPEPSAMALGLLGGAALLLARRRQ
jgi:hypothetical protein